MRTSLKCLSFAPVARLLALCALLLFALPGCKKAAGEACDKGTDCEPDLACVDGSCMSLRAEGARCSKANQCRDGMSCSVGKCFARRGESEDCDTADQCAEGLTCHGGECASEAGIERAEKERAVKSKRALGDLFSDAFEKKINTLGAMAADDEAVWRGGPDEAPVRDYFRGAIPAMKDLATAVAAQDFDAVPGHIAAAGLHLAPLLATSAKAQPRLTEDMKAAMAAHDSAAFGGFQRQQRANGKLLRLLKELVKSIDKGMEACVGGGPPEARVAALKQAVKLRDGTAALAKDYNKGISRLISRTVANEPHGQIRDEMQEIAAGGE